MSILFSIVIGVVALLLLPFALSLLRMLFMLAGLSAGMSDSFHVNELKKIRSRIGHGSARETLRKSIREMRSEIDSLRQLPHDERKRSLVQLLNRFQKKRHSALAAGARSHGDAAWAAAAAGESWILTLLQGSPDEIAQFEGVLLDLERT